MDNLLNQTIEYAHEHQEDFIQSLNRFLEIPSISADPAYQKDIQEAAQWLANHLESIGMKDIRVIPTALNPVVYAEYFCGKETAPTLLLYGHYDVQPVEPLDLWKTSPFQPIREGDLLFARGASDMKGQIMASLNALETLIRHDALNVNLQCLFEGEEEIGSPNIRKFLLQHKDLYHCDIAFNMDAGMLSKDTPTVTTSLRGIAFFELLVTGPDHDLHSGSYGGVIDNPAHVMSRLVAGMHDEHGKINLPGYYEDIPLLSKKEREDIARLPITSQDYLEQTGAPQIWGDADYTAVERVGARPSLDVNGFEAGYNGIGQKTIIPSWAKIKLSSRIVPGQDPDKVHAQLKKYLEQNAPDTVHWELSYLSGSKASRSDADHPITSQFITAAESQWNKKVYLNRMGASIPIVGLMQEILGIDSILSGFSLPDDNIHAPNEKLSLDVWQKGIDTIIQFFYNIGK